MKHIITEYDINKLIKFTNQLGTLNILLPKETGKIKMIFILSCILCAVLVVLCIIDIYCLLKNDVSAIMITLTISVITIVFVLFAFLQKNNNKKMEYVQQFRKLKLKNYFKNYSSFDLEIVVELLQKKIDNTRFDTWKMIIIIGTLIYPIWEYYITVWLNKSEINDILFEIITRAIIIVFGIIVLYFINIPINYILCSRKRRIENIIFILKYIINERKMYEKDIKR